ncbi:hypothetical protein OHW49_17575, partial [Acinetobacter baumannii]|nr:hypothetical protein [Acinetobacter baumannii]
KYTTATKAARKVANAEMIEPKADMKLESRLKISLHVTNTSKENKYALIAKKRMYRNNSFFFKFFILTGLSNFKSINLI